MERALSGIRVVELGQLVAGPFAGSILGSFGAEVIKIESPSGDPIRTWRELDESGTSLWWRSLARNKRSVCIDLRTAKGQELVRRLVGNADVLVENFRPGTLEKWNLDPADLQRDNPGLIVARVSGYGQDGPYKQRPGYASVCEAMGGLRHLTGHPGQAPIRANLSLGDSLAGIHAALGVAMALVQRQRSQRGQVVDTAIAESVLHILEAVIPEFGHTGTPRQPSGTTVSGIAPTGTYRTRDENLVVIGANGNSVFTRLCEAMGRASLAYDPRFADNPSRVKNREELDAAIEAWTQSRSLGEVLNELESAAVPSGPIYTAADIRNDPHFQARGLFHELESPAGNVTLPAAAPRLSGSPERVDHPGPELGEHTRGVLHELGLTPTEIEDLVKEKIIVSQSS